MKNISRILVLSRMNQDSRNAIKQCISLARKLEAQLVALHLVSNTAEMMVVNSPDMFPLSALNNYMVMQQSAEENVEEVIKEEQRLGFPIKELVSEGDPLDEVVKAVKEEDIDLLVMIAQEEGRIEHALLGGENNAIIRKMPCSILLLKEEPEAIE
jgi:nucleotide-binding universal stress UspA family protein